MRIHQISDLSFDHILNNKYDLAVFGSGYEARCTYIPKQIQPLNVSQTAVLGFKELPDSDARKQHDDYFRSYWHTEPIVTSASDDFLIQQILTSRENAKPVYKILVDFSSMSRHWYSGILNWARYGSNCNEIIVDFVYALGKYEEQDLPMIIEEMLSIPGCEGGATSSRNSVAIFGLGFNGWASLSVLERLEADEVFAFIAAPGSSPEYPDRVRKLNDDFLNEPRVKKHVLELPLRSIENCYRFLCELVAPHYLNDAVTLVPMGPKPHILASILVAMRFPEISCMRVSMTRQRPEKVEPTGEIIAVRVIVRKGNE